MSSGAGPLVALCCVWCSGDSVWWDACYASLVSGQPSQLGLWTINLTLYSTFASAL